MSETTRHSLRTWLCADSTPRDFRNMLRVAWRLAAWGVAFAAGAQLIDRELLPAGPISWLVAGLPSVIAVFVLTAYGRFLREADELLRVIQLTALALAFGGGFFVIGGFSLFERLGAPRLDQGDAIVVMSGLYAIGVVLGRIRYR